MVDEVVVIVPALVGGVVVTGIQVVDPLTVFTLVVVVVAGLAPAV